MRNIQTELDEHNVGTDNMQTELDQCITDICDAQTKLMGDMDDVQNKLGKNISDNESNLVRISDQMIYDLNLSGLYYNSASLKQII